ncbi:MAG: 3-deoxy-manno-octulosonate cytidylyltransferase [Deltaproteobacteria bacterium]|nr:3-deoxy-manno-octulosonate cytidylyltransferase [Deltaproteobacteria bacterium]MBW2089856.1 3-deoxy-manno-octulosonate cytidylyltransferase [Deltaproteobacteria bacterium]MBW2321456.1 3-deoxy-manno-octulosonate cytidylyltransferase [Deltaproteobacteria bacterium]
MTHLPKCYGIIPARYGSKRFPGKPLAEILGKPMFWHVFKRASRCPQLSKTILATDDHRIISAAKNLNVPVIKTRDDHLSGTDRVLEAAERLNVPENAVVVNIQGDEPTLEPDMLTELIRPFKSSNVRVTTLARKINIKEAKNPDRVKLVFSKSGRALYFSRSLIPYHHSEQKNEFYGHIGLYAFRMNSLRQFVELGPSGLEITEKLEQLRLLENEIPVHVVITQHQSIGVDRPEDLEIVTGILGKT